MPNNAGEPVFRAAILQNPRPALIWLLPSAQWERSKRYHQSGEFESGMIRFLPCFIAFLAAIPVLSQRSQLASTSTNPGVTSTFAPEVEQFQKMEDTWAAAVNARDQYGLELVLSPLFIDVAADGQVSTRNQQVASVISGDDKTMHLDLHVVSVRMLGDVAVANGTYVLHHKASSGQVDEKGVFTHVFQKARGGWLCVNSQRTMVKSDSKSKGKKTIGRG